MEAKYVVLLWHSVLVLVPFNIVSIDTSVADDERESKLAPSPLVVKLLRFCKDSLASAGPMRTMACLLLSKLLTRPDMTQAFNGLVNMRTILGAAPSCYQFEVNCQRPSAAAFQENVRRQGSYLHGIDIANAADYFSLPARTNSYHHVAVCISQYEGYLHPFVEDLVNSKICHWIHKASSEQLYLVLFQDGGVVAEDKMEESMQLVSETCWEGDIELAKRDMSRLFDLADLEMGVHVNLNTTGDENA